MLYSIVKKVHHNIFAVSQNNELERVTWFLWDLLVFWQIQVEGWKLLTFWRMFSAKNDILRMSPKYVA